MRKPSTLIFALVVIMSLAGPVQADHRVVVNSHLLTFQETGPIYDNRNVLLPLRLIFEAQGAQVNWDDDNRTVTCIRNGNEIKLVIGGQAYKNGQPMNLDVPARIINGRILVPLRFVGEALDNYVDLDTKNRTITIAPLNTVSGIESPTKTLSAFAARIKDDQTDVYIRKEGKEERVLTVTPGVKEIIWSPDGKQLLVKKNIGSEIGSAIIYSTEDKSTINFSFLSGPFWSPDGKKLATSLYGAMTPWHFPTRDAVIFDIKSRTYERFAKGCDKYYFTVESWENDGRIKYIRRLYLGGTIHETFYYNP